jgi:mono/diheme cytochrome c family protein
VRRALLVAAVLATACQATRDGRAREYMPDMVRSPAYKAFAPNAATRDGLTLQTPVEGTLARGQRPFHFTAGEGEAIRAGRELTNPFAATPTVLGDGQGLFQIYCSLCHGAAGNGDGHLVGKIPPPPSYRSARLLSFAPGRMFHVLTLGSGKMPSYAGQLSADERWKVITYVTAGLQGKIKEAP